MGVMKGMDHEFVSKWEVFVYFKFIPNTYCTGHHNYINLNLK
jgi:hypothetical protein